jgi:hypothetical protein
MEEQLSGSASSEQIFSENTEYNRYGIICVILLIVGCSGGLAVGLGGVKNTLSLIMIVIPTMTTLSLLLAVAPMKYILPAGITSTIINLLLMVYFLIT